MASKPGKGTTFTFSIETILEKESDQEGTNNTQTAQYNSSLKDKQNGEQKLAIEFSKQYPIRILVAEDNSVNVLVINKILNKLGYKPETAKNGQEVLNMMNLQNYNLIFMDVQMPEVDGLEATRTIHETTTCNR